MFLLVAGFFLPPVAVILMAAPILLPIITTAGFDPIWFAVVLTINMEIGLISPPVGLNLYVINGIAPDISLQDDPDRVAALRRCAWCSRSSSSASFPASRPGSPTSSWGAPYDRHRPRRSPAAQAAPLRFPSTPDPANMTNPLYDDLFGRHAGRDTPFLLLPDGGAS